MKQFWILGLVALLVSCGNDNEPNVNDEKELVEVEFNVSALDTDVQPMSRGAISQHNEISAIEYSLTNTRTYVDYSGKQTRSESGDEFGNIKLSLPAGNYGVTFIAYDESGNGVATLGKNRNGTLLITLKDKDVFNYHSSMEIKSGKQNYNIELSRLNGALQVKFNDDVPEEVGNLNVAFDYCPFWYVLNNEIYADGGAIKNSANITINNGKFSDYNFYVLPQNNCNVNLTLYDKQDNSIGTTSVVVNFYKNKRTIIQGNLMNVINQKPFDITVTDDWDDDVIYPVN